MPQQNCKCNETHETGLTAATTPNRLENSIKQSSYKKKIGAECAMIDSDDLQGKNMICFIINSLIL